MPQSTIKLEIDPADYEKVKQQFIELREIADGAALRVLKVSRYRLHWIDVAACVVSFFAGFGVCWLAFVGW